MNKMQYNASFPSLAFLKETSVSFYGSRTFEGSGDGETHIRICENIIINRSLFLISIVLRFPKFPLGYENFIDFFEVMVIYFFL